MECPGCQFENPQDSLFCGKCGAPLEISCSKCGEIVVDDELFKKIDDYFMKEGADAWFKYDIADFIEIIRIGCNGFFHKREV